jgi:hypothetical protein
MPTVKLLSPQSCSPLAKLEVKADGQEVKAVGAIAIGAAVTGAIYLALRRSRSEYQPNNFVWEGQEVAVTSIDELLEYNTGGLLRDLAAWLVTPRVTAIRVTGYRNRIPCIPQGVCNLVALTDLKLSDNNIACLPREISRLTALRDIDISGNSLEELPREIGALTALTSLNAMGNQLGRLPESIGALRNLKRLGLKNNRLTTLPPSIGQLTQLQELFLTDNLLESLPEEITECKDLVKLQASHNALHSLPGSLGGLPRLELLRVACCKVEELPQGLADSRSLAWLSLASNPLGGVSASPRRSNVTLASFKDVEISRKLGDGASGEVFEGRWRNRHVAVKLFRSDRSPDGHSRDEIAIACALSDRHLIRVLARLEEPLGLIMEYVDGKPMAEKPNANSLLRCRWAPDAAFELPFVLRAAAGVASALEHMHARGFAHGDVYAHNVLADEEGNAVLCDYGASFQYPRIGGLAPALEGQDARAFGLFLRDMVSRMEVGFDGMEVALSAQKELLLLVQQCTSGPSSSRPRFGAVVRKLRGMQKAAGQGGTPRSDSRLVLSKHKGDAAAGRTAVTVR